MTDACRHAMIILDSELATAPSNCRVLGIWDRQLFASTGVSPAGLFQIGTGLPTIATSTISIVATVSPYGFAAFDLNPNEPGVDTLYLSDDGTVQGIKRFSRMSGTWFTMPEAILGPPVRQLTCYREGTDVACLATTSSTLYRVRDVNAGLPSSQTALTSIGTAGTNTAFRGIALMPL